MQNPLEHLKMNRSSRPEVFCKKGVLINFPKFSGHRCFPLNFVKFLGTPFLIEHLRWLLLGEAFCETAFNGLTIFAKNFSLDIRLGSKIRTSGMIKKMIKTSEKMAFKKAKNV